MLKESLYKDILSNFEKGLMWESAIQVTSKIKLLTLSFQIGYCIFYPDDENHTETKDIYKIVI